MLDTGSGYNIIGLPLYRRIEAAGKAEPMTEKSPHLHLAACATSEGEEPTDLGYIGNTRINITLLTTHQLDFLVCANYNANLRMLVGMKGIAHAGLTIDPRNRQVTARPQGANGTSKTYRIVDPNQPRTMIASTSTGSAEKEDALTRIHQYFPANSDVM
jgi:hypothetical protein